MGVLIKNVDVCKFSDFDKICILTTTILMKDNFGFLKILWIESRLNFLFMEILKIAMDH